MKTSATGPNTANDLNQYDATTDPTESFTYDEDGNLTQDDTFTYMWDAENRLIRVETRIGEDNGTPISPRLVKRKSSLGESFFVRLTA